MDKEKPKMDADLALGPGPGMPKTTPFAASLPAEDVPTSRVTPSPLAPQSVLPASPLVEPTERTGVFGHLVTDDSDIAGLVAYSIYKQNKLDWLTAFEKAKSRPPNDAELASYIIGEGTPRRLATYRHLAEATLAGNGPEVGGSAGKASRTTFRRPGLSDKAAMTTGLLATYALIAVLFLIGFLIAAHYTMSSR